MAERLLEYYTRIGLARGLSGEIQLANRTGIPPTSAVSQPDSRENLVLFERVVEELLAEEERPPSLRPSNAGKGPDRPEVAGEEAPT